MLWKRAQAKRSSLYALSFFLRARNFVPSFAKLHVFGLWARLFTSYTELLEGLRPLFRIDLSLL